MAFRIDLSSLEKVRADFKIDTKFSSDRLELPRSKPSEDSSTCATFL